MKCAYIRVLTARGSFGCKRLIHPHRFFRFPNIKKSNSVRFVLSNQRILSLTERALCKPDSGFAQIILFGGPFRKQRDRENRGCYGRDFRGPWSRGRTLGRGALVSLLEDEGVPKTCPVLILKEALRLVS